MIEPVEQRDGDLTASSTFLSIPTVLPALSELQSTRKAPAMLPEFLAAPRAGECLLCYAYRMMNSQGCDGTLRWAKQWRDLRAPRHTALERRLGSSGGYCDCEIFLNGWTASPVVTRTGPGSETDDDDEEDEYDVEDEVWPDPMPACRGGRHKSPEPCPLWLPRPRRGGW
jgi:hypothetical protein